MPNQHKADKEVIGFYISRELSQKIRKAAKQRGLTITAFVEETLTHATRKIALMPEDYRQIAEATERTLRNQATKNSRSKSEGGSKKRTMSSQ